MSDDPKRARGEPWRRMSQVPVNEFVLIGYPGTWLPHVGTMSADGQAGWLAYDNNRPRPIGWLPLPKPQCSPVAPPGWATLENVR